MSPWRFHQVTLRSSTRTRHPMAICLCVLTAPFLTFGIRDNTKMGSEPGEGAEVAAASAVATPGASLSQSVHRYVHARFPGFFPEVEGLCVRGVSVGCKVDCQCTMLERCFPRFRNATHGEPAGAQLRDVGTCGNKWSIDAVVSFMIIVAVLFSTIVAQAYLEWRSVPEAPVKSSWNGAPAPYKKNGKSTFLRTRQ
mmetsp:Transcript_32634/g.91658  ORF Transcript_32634/g.91658 Transcript_32634/m.91658 type:complete len:196 (-) Transcript_32634:27-614(-)